MNDVITRLLLALALCIFYSPAFALGNATLRVIPYAVPTCPFGSAYADGCAAAPAGGQFQEPNAFQPGGYFNATAGTTTNYMATNCDPGGATLCRPAWNVAGVDYPIGDTVPSGSRLDPAVSVPNGCAFITNNQVSGGTGGNLLHCGNGLGTGTFSGDFENYDFGPIGGHDCTAIRIEVTTGLNSLTFKNDNFYNNNGVCAVYRANAGAMIILGASCCTYSGGITMTSVSADGGAAIWDNNWGGLSPDGTTCQGPANGDWTSHAAPIAGQTCNPSQLFQFGANVVSITYSTIRNFAASPVNPSGSTGAQFTMLYDWVENWCVNVTNCHAEWYDGSYGGTALGTELGYSTVTASGPNGLGNAQNGPVPMVWTIQLPASLDSLKVHNNTFINPFIGGSPASFTFSGCIGQPPTGGSQASPTCSATPGNIFYETQISAGSMGHGLALPAAGSCGGTGFGTYKRIPGPYAPSGGLTIIDEWEINQINTATGIWPFFTTAGACIGATGYAHIATAGILSGQNDHLGAADISYNHIDVSSQVNSGSVANSTLNTWLIDSVAPTNFTGVITGGNTITPTANVFLFANEFINGTGIDGCSTSLADCPQVVTGGTYGPTGASGTSFTITPSITQTGSYSLAGQRPTICDTLPTFTNNIDMANTNTSTYINRWTGITTSNEVGCQ